MISSRPPTVNLVSPIHLFTATNEVILWTQREAIRRWTPYAPWSDLHRLGCSVELRCTGVFHWWQLQQQEQQKHHQQQKHENKRCSELQGRLISSKFKPTASVHRRYKDWPIHKANPTRNIYLHYAVYGVHITYTIHTYKLIQQPPTPEYHGTWLQDMIPTFDN